MKTALLLTVFMVTQAFSALQYDTINNDTTWSGKIDITENILIEDNAILRIESGSSLLFHGSFEIRVKGSLQACGTALDSISFTASDTTTGWRGIIFDQILSSNDSSIIAFSSIRHCKINAENGDSSSAVYVDGFSKLVIHDSDIRNNNSSWLGGGIFLNNASPIIKRNIISHNSAKAGGGIYCYNNSNPLIKHNQISQNRTLGAKEGNGGGICCSDSSHPLIMNNVISQNYAQAFGGGIFCSNNCYPKIVNNTIVSNEAQKNAGGIFGFHQDLIIVNCILWNNINLWYQSFNQILGCKNIRYSDIQGGGDGEGNFDLEPFFRDIDNGDFHLSENSPCIDAGDTSFDYSLEPYYNGMCINVGAFGNTQEATISSPQINIPTLPLDFDTLYFGQATSKSITVQNRGMSRLNLTLKSVKNGYTSDTSYSILGGDTQSIDIKFSPVKTGYDSCLLWIKSNDELTPQASILLIGFGILGGQCDGTLYSQHSPFLLSENLVVPHNKVLNIEAGVTIHVDSAVLIKVIGSLIAEGTQIDSIRLTSSSTKPSPGIWQGLHFEGDAQSSVSKISYVCIEYADNGIFMYANPVPVHHCRFSRCKSWGIVHDMIDKGEYYANKFEHMHGAIKTIMCSSIIENNTISDVKTALAITGSSRIHHNKILNIQNAIEIYDGGYYSVLGNEMRGTEYANTIQLKSARLHYLENKPQQALNAKYGIIVNEGELADLFLIDMNTWGDETRKCITSVDTRFEEVKNIPQSGYVCQLLIDRLKTFIVRTKDGGHAKIRPGAKANNTYGYWTLDYVYVPAGIDTFPTNKPFIPNDGILVHNGTMSLIDNVINNFSGSGITFENADIDSFIHNDIYGNKGGGIVFHGPSFFLSDDVIFQSGTNLDEFNRIYENDNYNFINGTQSPIKLPYIYWGTTDSLSIASCILDCTDYPSLGCVNFSPYLDESHNLVTDVLAARSSANGNFKLDIYPNPTNSQTVFNFSTKKKVKIAIELFNILSQRVKTYEAKTYPAGTHTVTWNGKNNFGNNVPSGIYIIRFTADKRDMVKRFTILR